MSQNELQIEESWKPLLESETTKTYMSDLRSFLKKEYQNRKPIYPKTSEYFEAFNQTPFDQVKVVILGQDPYHGAGQAHGLSFSVKPGVNPPPSLQNIYKELKSDLNIDIPQHGYLLKWAKQGVLLLNSVLTVERGKAASHRNRGWEDFTDKVIGKLNEREAPMVFLLWGSYAQKKGAIVNQGKHLVLKAPHPSPFSADRGFFGCRHFSQANHFLTSRGLTPIDWSL